MLENLALPFDLGTLATRAYMSRRTLSRRFRQETGLSPMAWLADARIDRAREILETTTEPVENIGRLTGLGAPVSVRAAFHRRIGSHRRSTVLSGADRRRQRRRPRPFVTRRQIMTSSPPTGRTGPRERQKKREPSSNPERAPTSIAPDSADPCRQHGCLCAISTRPGEPRLPRVTQPIHRGLTVYTRQRNPEGDWILIKNPKVYGTRRNWATSEESAKLCGATCGWGRLTAR